MSEQPERPRRPTPRRPASSRTSGAASTRPRSPRPPTAPPTCWCAGPGASDDAAVGARLISLTETEGIEAIAELWSSSPADSLAGCLWRLYVLRSWVHADPRGVAAEFEAGRTAAPVARVVAGVADPPGPDELRAMIDEVLRGIAEGDFADVLFRAAAFARVVATGRAALADRAHHDVRRMLLLAEQLEAAGHTELAGRLP